MKKLLLLTMYLMGGVMLHAQYANDPDVTEDTLVINTAWDVGGSSPANMNAYSKSNIAINGTNSDLYAFTWDRGVNNTPAYNIYAGLAVRQYNAGTQVNSASTPAAKDIVTHLYGDFSNQYINSLEPGILRNGDSTIVALTYFSGNFNPSTGAFSGNFFLNLYLWNYNNSGILDLYQTINLSHTSGIPQGWIHQDVNNADSMVIAWEQDGRIFTVAGVMKPSGLLLGHTAILDVQTDAIKPDVAMMRTSDNELNLYYTFISGNSQNIYVYQGNFGTLFNITGTFLSVSQLYTKNAMGTYGLPRIDAPDNAQYAGQDNVWSCVVADHIPNHDFIFAVTSNNISGIHQKILNDGGLTPLTDVSLTTGSDTFNCRPTVAFSNRDLNIYYAWTFRNYNWYFTYSGGSFSPVSYLSAKTTLGLTLMNNPANEYFLIPKYTYQYGINNAFPSVALSTENDENSQLFTAFTEGMANYYWWPYYGYKTIDWSLNTGYKPDGSTGIVGIDNSNKFSVSPNPFESGLELKITDSEKQTYEVVIFDLLGKKVYGANGNLEEINNSLRSIGNQLISGTYFIKVTDDKGAVYRKEVIKW